MMGVQVFGILCSASRIYLLCSAQVDHNPCLLPSISHLSPGFFDVSQCSTSRHTSTLFLELGVKPVWYLVTEPLKAIACPFFSAGVSAPGKYYQCKNCYILNQFGISVS